MKDKPDTRLLPPRIKRNESQVPEDQSKDDGSNQADVPDASVGDWPVINKDFYVVSGEHARGGIGRILEATDRRLDRTVALKELLDGRGQEEAAARFVREALVTARLQHPGIVPVYEAARWPNGKPFYTMKMVTGQSLADVLKEKKTFEERLALIPNMIAVAEAMAYAHEKRVIHRDLKPSNILIGKFGETMVIDWGLATELIAPRHGDSLPSDSYEIAGAGLTAAGSVMGTPEYMPPEQAQGETVDERADVYALGAVLYKVLAGVPPFEGDSASQVLEKVLSEEPVPVEKRQRWRPRRSGFHRSQSDSAREDQEVRECWSAGGGPEALSNRTTDQREEVLDDHACTALVAPASISGLGYRCVRGCTGIGDRLEHWTYRSREGSRRGRKE